jgi:hypothetical protein
MLAAGPQPPAKTGFHAIDAAPALPQNRLGTAALLSGMVCLFFENFDH